MKTIEHYESIASNYINGNISDFKQQVKKLSKKELIAFLFHLATALGENHYMVIGSKEKAAQDIVHKYL